MGFWISHLVRVMSEIQVIGGYKRPLKGGSESSGTQKMGCSFHRSSRNL